MKSLYEYLQMTFEEEGGAGTFIGPASTIGMGNPTDAELISAPVGGIPHGDTKITRRRKRRKKGQPDYKMTDDVHNT